MITMTKIFTSVVLGGLLISIANAWAPRLQHQGHPITSTTKTNHDIFDKKACFDPLNMTNEKSVNAKAILVSSVALLGAPMASSAATAFAPAAIPSALAAYGHFVSILGMLGCVMIERMTIKPGMSGDDEDLVAAADIAYGLFGVSLVYTGYLRLTQYEKGWLFYQNEPLFWLKIAFVGVLGAASFFNTTTIIKRAVAKRNGELEPLGDALAKRMIQICNAEIVALGVIPLTATLMARGVGYSDSIPWIGEAAFAALVSAGLSYKYIKEALTFKDGPTAVKSDE
ncbi:hypothetical protein FisN_21Lh125 [Fistulifera solaris]|uniref:Uncharacterized protein n=1 Tax=Fistulifera solaris TaxID=1519565 RepID=A0A1Z5J8W8_FISSO|nr:hypothetical protein FisN_21Lh125 [Fistulifera solaris]|eukprot:GAX10425.1 hypothetical protein FisN_21Lh125 [Fistulifera solaris]